MITITCTKKFEDTNGAIRIQHNGQKKKYKRTNNDLQNIYKTKDRVTRTPLKTKMNSVPPEG